MTTIVTGVRLQIEGGASFVGQLKDVRAGIADVADVEKVAAAAGVQLASATEAVATASQSAAGGLGRAAEAANENAAAFGRAKTATNQYASVAAQLRAELDPMFAVQQRFDQELARADQLFAAGAISAREYAAAQKLANDNLRAGAAAIFAVDGAQDQLNKNLGLARAGWQGVGYQLQDVFASYASGSRLTTIAAQQVGQLSSAISMIAAASETSTGAMGRFATFMGGGWGIAIGVAVSLAGALANALYTSADATAKAHEVSTGLKDVQGLLGDVFDLTTGKIKLNTAALDANTQAALLNLQAKSLDLKTDALKRRQSFEEVFRDAASPSWFDLSGAALAGDTVVEGIYKEAEGSIVATVLRNVEKGKLSPTKAFDRLKGLDYSGAQISRDKALQALQDIVSARGMEETASLIDQSLAAGALDPALRKEPKAKKPKKVNLDAAARREAARVEFGEDTDKKIGSIRDQFADIPTQVRKVNEALRQLDDLASDVQRRKPPNYKDALGDIAALKQAIRDNLDKPFGDYLEKARESAEIDKLLIAGKDDQAAALKIVLDLQREMGPLTRDQLQTVLATVEAQRRQSLVFRDQRALIQTNVRAVQDMRAALTQTVADALRGRLSLNNILSSFANSYINQTSQRIVEKLFGDTLRSLEDQASGQGKVDAAGTAMATAMDKGSSAVVEFANVVREANRAIGNASARSPLQEAVGDAFGSGGNAVSSTLQGFLSGLGDKLREQVANDNGADAPITVIGKRTAKSAAEPTGNILVDMAGAFLGKLGLDIPAKVSTGVKSTLSKLETALPGVLSGAFTGASASRIILGDRGTGGSIGSAIGGTLGGKLGEKVLEGGLSKIAKGLGSFAGPIGSILGGVVGGLLGGAFKSTTKGYAVVTNSGVSSGGNNNQLVQQAASSGSGLQSTINQIAQQLGASVGNYSVSIGKRSSGWISVSASGSSQVADKSWKQANAGGDLIYDGKDEAAAIAVAISNAIADGAISGISQKVQAALLSTKDIDSALREAVKVQDLELALGGVQAALEKEFRSFEQTAKERLSLAQKYGFDIVEVEKLNAKERLALSEKLLKEQVGSLQELIDEMTSGSLYEGGAVDQRNALLAKISATQADANAGVEGAADKLANLYQQLNSVSKDAFGTTGGFAADRQAIIDGAQQAIAAANARVAAADKATDPALQTTNTLLDEQAGQLAKLTALTGLSADYLKSIAAALNTTDLSNLRAQLAY